MSSGGCERLRQITVEPCMLAVNPVYADLRGRATSGAFFGRWNSDGLLNRSTKKRYEAWRTGTSRYGIWIVLLNMDDIN